MTIPPLFVVAPKGRASHTTVQSAPRTAISDENMRPALSPTDAHELAGELLGRSRDNAAGGA
ncbi:hypothetical protein GCM10010187_09540 [Actinomadura coerulea]|nr:hypothetical protein GCM10010187_09540 [Actinomadura coerulea]